MLKNVLVPGLFGALVLILWTFLVDAILGFNSKINMKQIPNERVVYEVLKANVVEPGRYVCNPAVTMEERFPENEPVFSILFAGRGHEAAGREVLLGLFIYLAAPILAAWMLSKTSARFMARYTNRVCFFIALGIFLALVGDLKGIGIGGYPFNHALLLAARTVFDWTLVGLVVAWRMRPATDSVIR